MIVSNDSIMKSPYDITATILNLLTTISEKLGEVNAAHLQKPSPSFCNRQSNKIKSLHPVCPSVSKSIQRLQTYLFSIVCLGERFLYLLILSYLHPDIFIEKTLNTIELWHLNYTKTQRRRSIIFA